MSKGALLAAALVAATILWGCGCEPVQVAGGPTPMPPPPAGAAEMLALAEAAAAAPAFRDQLEPSRRLGRLEIPRLGMNEWVVEGTTPADLRCGTGHLEETPLPGMGGNFTIAGDRVLYSAPLLRADLLQPGDEVIMHMPYGVFHYRVESVTRNAPDDISVTYPRGYDSITLSTCDPPWSTERRLTVSARLVRVEAAG